MGQGAVVSGDAAGGLLRQVGSARRPGGSALVGLGGSVPECEIGVPHWSPLQLQRSRNCVAANP